MTASGRVVRTARATAELMVMVVQVVTVPARSAMRGPTTPPLDPHEPIVLHMAALTTVPVIGPLAERTALSPIDQPSLGTVLLRTASRCAMIGRHLIALAPGQIVEQAVPGPARPVRPQMVPNEVAWVRGTRTGPHRSVQDLTVVIVLMQIGLGVVARPQMIAFLGAAPHRTTIDRLATTIGDPLVTAIVPATVPVGLVTATVPVTERGPLARRIGPLAMATVPATVRGPLAMRTVRPTATGRLARRIGRPAMATVPATVRGPPVTVTARVTVRGPLAMRIGPLAMATVPATVRGPPAMRTVRPTASGRLARRIGRPAMATVPATVRGPPAMRTVRLTATGRLARRIGRPAMATVPATVPDPPARATAPQPSVIAALSETATAPTTGARRVREIGRRTAGPLVIAALSETATAPTTGARRVREIGRRTAGPLPSGPGVSGPGVIARTALRDAAVVRHTTAIRSRGIETSTDPGRAPAPCAR
ncbi:hypothetical protein ABIB25_003956 [Nakamurella sp. UYEF19]